MKIVKIIQITTMYYVREMGFISTFRKMLIKLILYLSCVMVALVTLTTIQLLKYQYDIRNTTISKIDFTKHPSDMKYILIWKPPKKNHNYGSKLPEGRSLFVKQNCKFTNCFITYDKHLLQNNGQINAIIFKVRDIEYLSPKDINLTRSTDQRYIIHSLRSSESHPVCNVHFDNFFNWTWTYKLDSDIPNPFINIFDYQNNLVGPRKGVKWISGFKHNELITMKTNKTKAVAWIVTKCKTRLKYQEFVNEMKKELLGYNYTIDVFGPCGDKRCPKGHIINCFKFIEKRYFFQMILEDAFIDDYISEVMVYAMSHLTVPIVLGSSSYKNFLPPGSYINAHIFDLKKLGAIIDFLIKYPVTYKYFFDWKNHYYYTTRARNHVCDLCTKLNGDFEPKIYSNFREWWNPNYKNVCHERRLHNMFKY